MLLNFCSSGRPLSHGNTLLYQLNIFKCVYLIIFFGLVANSPWLCGCLTITQHLSSGSLGALHMLIVILKINSVNNNASYFINVGIEIQKGY